MSDENPKNGVSVKELENFAKNHRFKLFLCLSFLLACFFSFVFFGAWSIVLATFGGIIGALASSKIEAVIQKVKAFCEKQETTTQLILGCAGLIVAIFLPPIVFLSLGLAGGKSLDALQNSNEK